MDTSARIRAVLAPVFEDNGQLDDIVHQIMQVLPPPAKRASLTPATGIVTAVAVKPRERPVFTGTRHQNW